VKDLDLIALPDTMGDAPDILLKEFTADKPSNHERAHAALHMAGYALGKLSPHAPGATAEEAAKGGRVLFGDDWKEQLKKAKAADGKGPQAAGGKAAQAVGAGGIDWKSILATALTIILSMMQK
jgi:hypothetical protein